MKCIVCGRPFYEGQGVVLVIAGRRLEFHSKKCALRFLTSLLERMDTEALKRAVSAVKLIQEISEGRAEVEFSAEDAGRTELKYLAEVVEAVIGAGAKILGNITIGEITSMSQG
jgi:hypothetical protein